MAQPGPPFDAASRYHRLHPADRSHELLSDAVDLPFRCYHGLKPQFLFSEILQPKMRRGRERTQLTKKCGPTCVGTTIGKVRKWLPTQDGNLAKRTRQRRWSNKVAAARAFPQFIAARSSCTDPLKGLWLRVS